MTNKQRALTALVIAAFIGGALAPTLIRFGTQDLPALSFTFIRAIFTTSLCLPILWRDRKALFTQKNTNGFLVLSICSTINFVLFASGINHTTIATSQLIFALMPLVVALLAIVLINETLTRQKILGLTLAITGVLIAIVFSQNKANLALGNWYGNLLIGMGMIAYSIYLVFSRTMRHLSSLQITSLMYVGVLIESALFVFVTQTALPFQFSTLQFTVFTGLAIVTLSQTLLVQYGLRHLSASTTAVTSMLSFLFGSLTGVVMFDEPFSFVLLVSMICISAGIGISYLNERSGWQTWYDQLKHYVHYRVR